MDDLSGLSWTAPKAGSPAQQQQKPAAANPAFGSYPALRPTPSPLGSGRNTPLSAQGSGGIGLKAPASKPAAVAAANPAQDSFSNLVNFGSSKSAANLSLREQQQRLEAEKRKKEEEKKKLAQTQFGDGHFLDSLGSRSGTPRTASPSLAPPPRAGTPAKRDASPADSDQDLFAAFNADTHVDNSSFFPPPTKSSPSPATAPVPGPKAPGLDLSNPEFWNQPLVPGSSGFDNDDDDPFGLNQLKPKANNASPVTRIDDDGEDDDLLGDLGRPVHEVRKKAAPAPAPAAPTFSRRPEPGKPIEDSSSDSEPEQRPPASNDPFDKAVAQLVDYGFTPENARRGLTESGAGINVQAAVNWLLDDAHRQAKEKATGQTERPASGANSRQSSRPRNGGTAAWMREEEGSRQRDNRSPASADGDFAKTAAAVGTSFLKTANSLWKTGQKKVQKAVSEFQQDGDPSQPKWMRSAQQDHQADGSARRSKPDVTEEAMMLEGGGPPDRTSARQASGRRSQREIPSREQSPALPVRPAPETAPAPKWQQAGQLPLDPRARLGRQAAGEESFQAYVSPARRKKTTPQPPEPKPPAEPDEDLLFGTQAPPKPQAAHPSRSSQPSPAPSRPSARPSPSPRPTPSPARPARVIPPVSAIALQSSTNHRLEGTAHFKRGDYAAAHVSYTNSLAPIPKDHPLTILLLCNRALTALKTGEPRQAVDDADAAVRLIGSGRGEGEHVEVHGENGPEKRDMRELYGKALSRKAEALEQMEKWADAAAVWQTCVEAGVGGSTAAAGRQRCQKALAPKPPAAARPKPAAAPKPRPQATSSGPSKSFEAVERLRAANQAAEREGEEKFALVDKVDARIAGWRDGKRDNLRALLSSLDNVLWEGSGWKKVGLHELVVANKVKIVYMKAIAKTHPDKIAPDATTEVRMIAGYVFSTLNEAWDKFKAENNL